MPNYDLNFFEAWDRLNEEISYDEVKNIINSDDAKAKEELKKECLKLCKMNPHWRAHPESWPYQLQLMYNAYIVEKGCLQLLNNSQYFCDSINAILIKENIPLKISKQSKFEFSNDVSHDKLSAVKLTNAEPDLVNINIKNAEDVVNIEIKATKGWAGNATNFHNAQLVLIYLIDKESLYLRARKQDGSYTQPNRITAFTDGFDCIKIYTDDKHIPSSDELKYSDDPNFKPDEADEIKLIN